MGGWRCGDHSEEDILSQRVCPPQKHICISLQIQAVLDVRLEKQQWKHVSPLILHPPSSSLFFLRFMIFCALLDTFQTGAFHCLLKYMLIVGVKTMSCRMN